MMLAKAWLGACEEAVKLSMMLRADGRAYPKIGIALCSLALLGSVAAFAAYGISSVLLNAMIW